MNELLLGHAPADAPAHPILQLNFAPPSGDNAPQSPVRAEGGVCFSDNANNLPNLSGIYWIKFPSGHYYIGSAKGKMGIRKRFECHRSRLRSNNHCNQFMQAVYNKTKNESCIRFEYKFFSGAESLSKEQSLIDLHFGKRMCLNISEIAAHPYSRGSILKATKSRNETFWKRIGIDKKEFETKLSDAIKNRSSISALARKVGMKEKTALAIAARLGLTSSARGVSKWYDSIEQRESLDNQIKSLANDGLSAGEISEIVGFSPDAVSRICKKRIGVKLNHKPQRRFKRNWIEKYLKKLNDAGFNFKTKDDARIYVEEKIKNGAPFKSILKSLGFYKEEWQRFCQKFDIDKHGCRRVFENRVLSLNKGEIADFCRKSGCSKGAVYQLRKRKTRRLITETAGLVPTH